MSYLELTPDRLARAIERTVAALTKSRIKFDTIAFRGLSGSLVAAGVGIKLNKRLVAIRKGESSHGQPVEHAGWEPVVRYVIVDDLIASGGTVKAIQESVKSEWPKARLVGVALYQNAYPWTRPNAKIIDATKAELIKEIANAQRLPSSRRGVAWALGVLS